MIAVLQRVAWAEVAVDGERVGRIELGLLVYVGIAPSDGPEEADRLAEKVAALRVFPDAGDKMNRSVRDVGGGVLAIPNFTLMGDARKGRRPAFTGAARPEASKPLYNRFVESLVATGCPTARGVFGAHMLIRSEADGPVNLIVEMPHARP